MEQRGDQATRVALSRSQPQSWSAFVLDAGVGHLGQPPCSPSRRLDMAAGIEVLKCPFAALS